ncbi:hypothetical protein QQF64_033757 [Cirrhinus molitorella]|uniref:ribonuclease H n=1 Tax=Cirrhinus molitorella TaxID=172907 RepID=A0ABR3MUV5_9TELE
MPTFRTVSNFIYEKDEFLTVPFGLSLAPRVFSKCIEAALTPLRKAGLRVTAYLDDLLLCAPSRQQAEISMEMLVSHLKGLGFKINETKSCLVPRQEIIYLGLRLNSDLYQAFLSEERIRFMRGARRLSRVSKLLIPPWDLSVVLNALSQPPFEPIENTDLKLLSLKVAMLLALSTVKRVGELHALSVHNSCMQFAMDFSRVTLKTNPAFVPKVSESTLAYRQVDLRSFHLPPFSSSEEERLHCLCPVRGLRHYVDRTSVCPIG